MAGVAQGDRARGCARRGLVPSAQPRRVADVHRHSDDSADAPGRVEPGRGTRRCRDRARRRGTRELENGGLIMTRTTEVMAHHDLIVGLAARHRLPTIYPLRAFVKRGGLISYGNEV